jgi:hypothetical protein
MYVGGHGLGTIPRPDSFIVTWKHNPNPRPSLALPSCQPILVWALPFDPYMPDGVTLLPSWQAFPASRPQMLAIKSFPIHHSLITLLSTLYSLVTEKAS